MTLCAPWCVAKVLQTLLCDVQNQVALGAAVLGQALEVVLDAGNRVGKRVQALPVRYGLAGQQLILNISIAGLQQRRGTFQRDHRQATADLGQQIGNTGQMLVIPLRRDEFDDRVFRLFQTVPRLPNDKLMNLCNVGGRQMARFVALVPRPSHHASQRGFDVEQGTGNIHQHGVIR